MYTTVYTAVVYNSEVYKQIKQANNVIVNNNTYTYNTLANYTK